ncbi:Glycosyltransferase involved in cell wall bisynthesis [Pricia antarctica]|uniref:Glycosyltransferase involved in cell wall bisynthesis n=1 Tax=Pricia antarctica TaxID=641691 RepID=A0A1G6YQI9_9FLAO|nr:glycosyltransferase [Pricia antarctica]SDD92572.1 Glycosyltransferase involved in cell wall bisynthesis [Pricia antarctica]
MKILLLIDSLVSGGMERRMVELVKGFREYPHIQLRVVVFSDKIHYKEIFDLDVTVTILKRVPKQNPMIFYKLYKLCKQWQPDLIHSWGTMSAIIAVPTSVFLGVKLINGFVVNALDNMKFFDENLLRARLTFPFSKVVVGNSMAGLKAYNVSEKKGICIYNGFNNERIAALEDKSLIKKKFNIQTKKIVGMVARFTDSKDYETFIKAGLIVLNQEKNITLVAIGHGENLAKCKEMVPSNFVDNFVFTGEQKDVESIVNTFDIGVLATNTKIHGEGISNAILEYMALGKPVIATTGGGTNEIVDHGKTGFLIPEESPEVLANRLIYLLNNTDEAIQMGIVGKQRIKAMFSIEKMTSAYYDLYQSLKG